MATKSQTRPVGQSGDRQQAGRLRQVAEHHPSRLKLFQRVYAGRLPKPPVRLAGTLAPRQLRRSDLFIATERQTQRAP